MLGQVINSNVDVKFNPPTVPKVKSATSALDVHAKPPHIETKVTGSAPGSLLLSSIIGSDIKKQKSSKGVKPAGAAKAMKPKKSVFVEPPKIGVKVDVKGPEMNVIGEILKSGNENTTTKVKCYWK